ncbi:hypothetical protein CTKZ_08490 [Cellulomonas algicola]|uniref:Uncharacterized protein n=1 Tax=Cellulomonas algicola TaxID=2071633 RepID=A0A401UX65_9CELL|nr:hypothetical protein [Cellulomonas algicola]GCD19287.1 hypothetical protein CTKZ_08490 [Cellulomonas algicola]
MRVKRLVPVVAAAAALFLASAVPAQAWTPASFTFSKRFSESWSTAGFNVDKNFDAKVIAMDVKCTEGYGNQFAVSLIKDSWPWDLGHGSATFMCAAGKTYYPTFAINSEGKFHFKFSKVDNGKFIKLSGTVSYPKQ